MWNEGCYTLLVFSCGTRTPFPLRESREILFARVGDSLSCTLYQTVPNAGNCQGELLLCLWNKTSGTNMGLLQSSREIPHPAPLPTTRAVIWALFKRVSAGADQTLSLHFLLSAGKGGFILFHNEGRGHSCCPWNSCDQLPQPCCPFPILVPLLLELFPHFTSSCAPDKTWRCNKRMTLCHCY